MRDHCHFSRLYRGALHRKCNLGAKRSWQVPVIFHNLSAFDSHLFVKELCDEGNIDVSAIPEKEDHYISFHKTKYITVLGRDDKPFTRFVTLQFIDSFRHFQCSLAKLVEYLPENEFHNMSKKFGAEELKLLT